MVPGFRSQGFGVLPIEETQRRLGRMGFRALELCVDFGAGRERLATSEHALSLAALTPSRSLVVTSPSDTGRDRNGLRESTWEALYELAQVAAELEAKPVMALRQLGEAPFDTAEACLLELGSALE